MTNPESPAFPAEEEANVNGTMGLTKRELFALVIMHGTIVSHLQPDMYARSDFSVKQADALIKRLEEK